MKNLKTMAGAASIALAAALALASCQKAATISQAYEYASVTRGSIESIVSSSGVLSVVSSVSVLAEMNGRIEKVNADFNSRVRKGQVLATINTDLLRLQSTAAQASVDKAQANYELQALAVQNALALSAKGLLSDYDLKTAQSNLKVCRAELSSAQAALGQIETQINRYAVITSPIDGTVLERGVDAGQSVVGGSSSTSTSLFTIAGDLSRMQIKAEVDELDIGSISVGQDVRFTVGSDPGHAYAGTVKEVRLVPETTDNVVYYYVIIDADNASLHLLPGMTASVSFIKQRKDDILVVPSAAFRFSPPSLSADEVQKELALAALGPLSTTEKEAASKRYDGELAARAASASAAQAGTRTTGLANIMGGGFGGPPGGPGGPRRTTAQAGQAGGQASTTAAARKPLWYLDGSGKPAVQLVQVGISDGSRTEVLGAGELEGRKFILKAK